MKTLGKLNINSEKILKNEDLIILKGGDGTCCVCLQPHSGVVMGYMGAASQQQCETACGTCGWDGSYGSWSYC